MKLLTKLLRSLHILTYSDIVPVYEELLKDTALSDKTKNTIKIMNDYYKLRLGGK